MDKPFRAAILATSIPLALLAIVIPVFGLLNKEAYAGAEVLTPVDICMQALLGLVAAAFLSSTVPAVRRKQGIAKGIRQFNAGRWTPYRPRWMLKQGERRRQGGDYRLE